MIPLPAPTDAAGNPIPGQPVAPNAPASMPIHSPAFASASACNESGNDARSMWRCCGSAPAHGDGARTLWKFGSSAPTRSWRNAANTVPVPCCRHVSGTAGAQPSDGASTAYAVPAAASWPASRPWHNAKKEEDKATCCSPAGPAANAAVPTPGNAAAPSAASNADDFGQSGHAKSGPSPGSQYHEPAGNAGEGEVGCRFRNPYAGFGH